MPIRTPAPLRPVFGGDFPVTIRIHPSENLPPFFFRELLEKFPLTEFRKVQSAAAIHIQFPELPRMFITMFADFADLLFAQAPVTIPIEPGKNPFALLFWQP